MNDELSAQLTGDWYIPAYAQGMLWVDAEGGAARCDGQHGSFTLAVPSRVLTVRWGGDEGAPLTQLTWQPDIIGWRGMVRLGGIVEAMHLTELPNVPLPLVIVYLSAQPLRPQTRPYALATSRANGKVVAPDYYAGVDDSQPPVSTPLLVQDDSPLVSAAHDSLSNGMPLHVYGRLANAVDNWHNFFALPIIWESVTLFAP